MVIALAPVEKPLARRIAREAAVDLVVLGRQVGKGMERAEKVGNASSSRPPTSSSASAASTSSGAARRPLVDAGGPDAAALRRVEIDQAIGRLDDELKAWSGGQRRRSGVHRRQARRARRALVAERAQLDAPWKAPDGTYFTNRLIPLRRSLPRDEKVAAAMRKLDAAIAAINLKNAKPPPPRRAGPAVLRGRRQVHELPQDGGGVLEEDGARRRWKTLVDGGKQNDYKCVGCHVTGYGEVGGSSLGHTESLRDVQCEVCHGPGSKHVAEEGMEDPPAVHQRDAGQHLHRLPHRAALGHLPVRGLPARHPGRRARRERAQEAGRRPDRPRRCAPPRSRARRAGKAQTKATKTGRLSGH